MVGVNVLPEANYISNKRPKLKVFSIQKTFVACIDTTWNGCIPDIKNYPYAELQPTQTANEYYLAFGITSEIYTSMRVYNITVNDGMVDDNAWLMLAIYTDPEGNKKLLWKIGSPIDIPSVDKVWIVRRDGKVYFAEVPTSLSDFTYIGDADKLFAKVYDQNNEYPPIIIKPKIAPLIILGIAAIIAGAGAYAIVEWHKADKEAEVKEHAINKQYEFLDKVYNDLKNQTIPPELRDAFIGLLEGHIGNNAITWEVPNAHTEDSNWLDNIFGFFKKHWKEIVLGIVGVVGLMLLILKWQVIVDMIKSFRDMFRRR